MMRAKGLVGHISSETWLPLFHKTLSAIEELSNPFNTPQVAPGSKNLCSCLLVTVLEARLLPKAKAARMLCCPDCTVRIRWKVANCIVPNSRNFGGSHERSPRLPRRL